MGIRILILILIFAILSISCSAINYSRELNYSNRDYSTFNYLGAKHNSTIFFLSGKEIKTSYISAKNDSLFYNVGNDTVSIPLSKIEKVIFKKWLNAVGQGFALGTITLFVSGFSLFVIMGDDAEGVGAGIIGLSLATIIGLSTLILTIIYGGETKYIFNKANNEQSNP